VLIPKQKNTNIFQLFLPTDAVIVDHAVYICKPNGAASILCGQIAPSAIGRCRDESCRNGETQTVSIAASFPARMSEFVENANLAQRLT
jgi:hypothetical protein